MTLQSRRIDGALSMTPHQIPDESQVDEKTFIKPIRHGSLFYNPVCSIAP